MSDVVFIDTETTGLDPDRHQIWEVALVSSTKRTDPASVTTTTGLWHLPVDLGRADSVALNIGRFHERYGDGRQITPLAQFATWFADLTRGKHLAGAVVSFDEERLRKLLRANGACPEWHYHLVDVEALAAGKLGLTPPWDSEELSRRIGVDPNQFERHTALGDALWAQAIYRAVMGGE